MPSQKPLNAPKNRTRPSKIFLIDDHPILRKGLTQLLEDEKDFEVCGQAADGAQALFELKEAKPDIAIVDISLEGMDGLELIKSIKAQFPAVQVLVLSMHDEAIYAERALRAGAKGYVMKQEASEVLISAIQKVLSGEIHLSQKMFNTIIKQMAGTKLGKSNSAMESLSDRELEVFSLIGRGHATREIAEKLCLSIKTVESYRENIKFKLKLKNATELVRRAVNWVEGSKS